MKVGFIGLGIMGSRMAANLLKNNFDLIITNRTKSKGDELIEQGAVWARSPREVAEVAEILLTMLSTPDVVRMLAEGGGGFLHSMKPNSIWVDCSTVNPSFACQMAKSAHEHSVRFVDAPVAGSKEPAEMGQLIFLAGGHSDDVEACQTLFNTMGGRVIHVGDHGKGAALKMVFNLLLAEAMITFSEAMSLGQTMGIASETLFKLLLDSPLVAPYLSAKKNNFVSNHYDPAFPLEWMQKDLQLISTTADELGIPLTILNKAKEIYTLAMHNGLAKKDFSAIYKFLIDSPRC